MLQDLWEDGPNGLQLWEMLYAMSNLSRLTIQISMLKIEKYYGKDIYCACLSSTSISVCWVNTFFKIKPGILVPESLFIKHPDSSFDAQDTLIPRRITL